MLRIYSYVCVCNIYRRQAHRVTALEESETTGEPSDPSYASIATTIPTLSKTDSAVFATKHFHHHAVRVTFSLASGLDVDALSFVASMRRSHQDEFHATVAEAVRHYQGQITRLDADWPPATTTVEGSNSSFLVDDVFP